MPQKVYNNVEGHRLLDNGIVIEDVTTVSPPNITHSSTSMDAAGMAGAVDMPDANHVEAMEFTVNHNNGTNCKLLATPGKHSMEFRVVRQRFNVVSGEIEHESVKYRVTGLHKGTEKGTVEKGNPLGSTEKYSVTRYEEEMDGEIVTLIDVMAGIIKYNGVEYSSVIEKMLG